ncbi:MAG: UDP-N-acetylglucosamine 1-carboxyvinyltransferase [Candidatus Paceibacterota bacterium]
MNDSFIIKGLAGRKTLKGKIAVNGAKNAVLKALAASFLFKGEVFIKNVPHIKDVSMMVSLLESLGATVGKKNRTLVVYPPKKSDGHFGDMIAKRLRASIVVSGPILARYGAVSFPHPGGCVLGARPIDLFLEGYKKMGARVSVKGGYYHMHVPSGRLKGTTLFFKNQSVGATETFMMAAVLAEGKTILKNCACEPEIAHLAEFLNSCGAHIKGAGTHTIEIRGVKNPLRVRKAYTTLPDRLETGSFLILAALAGKDITITQCNPGHVEALIEVLSLSGVTMKVGKDTLRVYNNGRKVFQAADIKTHEYPGFPTDLQAPMAVFLSQAKGSSLIFETIFEARLEYVKELVHMGADISICDPHRAIVEGPTKLVGRKLESPDIRAGLAFILAAIIARDESIIHNVDKIDRGYERVEERLSLLGVSILRVPGKA